VIKLIPRSFELIGNILDTVATQFGIPPFIVAFVMVAFIILMVMSLVFLVLRFKQ